MRGSVGALTIAVLFTTLVPDEVTAISRRKECRLSCGATVEACVAQGGKRRRCKRQALKSCRKQGLAICTVTTTTTTLATGAPTSTNPGGSTTTVTVPTVTSTTSVHGCLLDDATDLRADEMPTVTFGVPSLYDPACIVIEAGQSITFIGPFGTHPLVGGNVNVGPDPSSPISMVNSDISKTIPFPNSGSFPFYCTEHGIEGMTGAVFVVP